MIPTTSGFKSRKRARAEYTQAAGVWPWARWAHYSHRLPGSTARRAQRASLPGFLIPAAGQRWGSYNEVLKIGITL